MSQNDLSIANQAGAAFRADLNNALQALASISSGSSAPSTTYAYQWWVDTTTGIIKRRNAANSAWIAVCTIDETLVLSRASDTILDNSDIGKAIIATGGFTQTLTAAATLGDGWFIDYIVDSGVTVVFDPNSSETIDGASTKSVVGPAQGRIFCNGTLFRTQGFIPEATEAARGTIEIATQAEILSGSSNVLAMTPGRFRGSMLISGGFQSTDQTITNAGALTLAHGLGVVPKIIQVALVCQTGELGYTAGDVVFINAHTISYNNNYGQVVVPDATNLNIRFGSAGYVIMNKGTGAQAVMTNGNWKARFYAWG